MRSQAKLILEPVQLLDSVFDGEVLVGDSGRALGGPKTRLTSEDGENRRQS